MINLSKNPQLPFEAQVLAFKWYQNIGDALSHLAHFGSFLSLKQREEAIEILKSYTFHNKELVALTHYVSDAPIDPNKSTIAKIQPSSL